MDGCCNASIEYNSSHPILIREFNILDG